MTTFRKFLVGGAVRDKLMGVESNDHDFVVVGAVPADLEALGYKNVGESFPVFMDPETGDQYALARKERKTGKGYLGFSVEFDPSVALADDLFRRDLTINAMAENLNTGEIVDPFGGMDDVKNKVLRHVSDAFAEDPLRVVRLARFYARYTDFSVALETFDMASRVVLSGEMDSLPDERFVKEFEKVLNDKGSDFGRFLEMLHMMGVFQHVKFFTKTFSFRLLNDVRTMGSFAQAVKDFRPDASVTEVMVGSFLASVTDDGALRGFGSDVRDAFVAAKAFMSFTFQSATAEQMVTVLKRVRSTRGMSKHAETALTVMAAVADVKAANWFVSADTWRVAAAATAAVDVEQFTAQFSGKELGDQLHAAMVAAVEKVLKG